jgi:myo-inositol-1(or 4)-monophosphatase
LKESRAALRRTLLEAARGAGRVLRRYFGKPLKISMKGPVDPVTEADKAAEKAVVDVLRRRFPDHGIVTEESAPLAGASPYRWVIDPLDGTINFSHGLPHACVSIALLRGGTPLMGAVLDPFRGELFWAERGRGAWLNGRRLRVSARTDMMKALFVTGFPYDRYKRWRYYLRFYGEVLRRSQGLRRMGAAALDMAYVACGRFDGYWEFNLKPWDCAAGWLLVEEAGGRVSDFRGRRFRLDDTRQTLCSNGRLHRRLVKILGRA